MLRASAAILAPEAIEGVRIDIQAQPELVHRFEPVLAPIDDRRRRRLIAAEVGQHATPQDVDALGVTALDGRHADEAGLRRRRQPLVAFGEHVDGRPGRHGSSSR